MNGKKVNKITSFVMNAIMQIRQPLYNSPVTGDNNTTS